MRDVIICNARLVATSSLTTAPLVTRAFGLSPPSSVSGGDCVSDPSRGLWLIADVDSSGVSMFESITNHRYFNKSVLVNFYELFLICDTFRVCDTFPFVTLSDL